MTGGNERASKTAYIATVVFGAAGRNAYFIIAAWVVFDVSRSATAVAVLLGLGSAAELLTSNLSGAFADRFDRRVVCLISDSIRLIAVTLTGFSLLLREPLPIIFMLWSLYSAADRAYLTALQAVIPSIVHRDRLVAFNSLSYMAMQLGNLASAVAAGFALETVAKAFSLVLPGACFLTSICTMMFFYCLSTRSNADRQRLAHGARVDTADLMPTRLPRGPIWIPTLVYSLVYTTGMLVNVMGPAFIERNLAGPAIQYGYLEAAWALGSACGCLYLIIVVVRRPHQGMLINMGFSGAILSAFLLFQNLPFALLQMMLMGACYNLSRVLIDVEVQRSVADGQLGRARGQIHTFCVALGLLIYALVALIGDKISPAKIFGTFGICTVFAALAIVILTHNRGGRFYVGSSEYEHR